MMTPTDRGWGNVTFSTKTADEPGISDHHAPDYAMLERARTAGVPFTWVTGDSVCGADDAIRRWAERHKRGYVLAVTFEQRLGLRPVTTWIKGLPKRNWQRLSAGDGAKGPRFYVYSSQTSFQSLACPDGSGWTASAELDRGVWRAWGRWCGVPPLRRFAASLAQVAATL